MALAAQGRPLDEIAREVGLTTAQVRRRLRRTPPRERAQPPPAAALALPLAETTSSDAAPARGDDLDPVPTEAGHTRDDDPAAADDGAGSSELTYEPADAWPPDEWTDPD